MSPLVRLAGTATLVASAACAARPHSPPREAVMLQSRWPVAARFEVQGDRTHAGRKDAARYTLATRAVPEGLELRLAPAEAPGEPDPRLARMLSEGLVALRVDGGGRITGEGVHQDLERWTEETRRSLSARAPDGDDADRALGWLMQRVVDDATGQMIRTLRLVWWASVSIWAGARLVRGEASGLTTTTRALPWGVQMPFTSDSLAVSVERLYEGPAPCGLPGPGRGCVRLSATVTLDPGTRARLRERLAAQRGPIEGPVDLWAEARIELVTDPATLVPRRLVVTEQRVVQLRGGDGRLSPSREASTFTWRFRSAGPGS